MILCKQNQIGTIVYDYDYVSNNE